MQNASSGRNAARSRPRKELDSLILDAKRKFDEIDGFARKSQAHYELNRARLFLEQGEEEGNLSPEAEESLVGFRDDYIALDRERNVARANYESLVEERDGSAREQQHLSSILREVDESWRLRQPSSEDEARARDIVIAWVEEITQVAGRGELYEYPGLVALAIATLEQISATDSESIETYESMARVIRELEVLARTGEAVLLDPLARFTTSSLDDRIITLRQRESLARTESAEREAASAAESAKKAAGTTGDAILTGHFQTYAKDALKRSYAYLTGAVVSLLAALAGASVVLWGTTSPDLRWQEVVKAIVTLPILGLSYYLSRESSIHAASARRAQEIEVRLKTIEAFTQVMSEDSGQDMRSSLGRMVFTDMQDGHSKRPNNLGKEVTEAIEAIRSVATIAVSEVSERAKKLQ